jgi:type IX secretion system PorP/SprF family membrane protein
MNIKMKNILMLVVINLALTGYSQDRNFSQFHELPLLRNPALAGFYKGDFRATSAYRNQWGSVTIPYTSQSLSVEMKSGISEGSEDYFSAGFQITRDMAGDSKFGKTQLLPIVAFHKLLSSERNSYLTLAFMGGIVQQRFDPTQLRFDDEFQNGVYTPRSTSASFNQTQLNYLDGSVGLSYTSEFENGIKYYIGGGLFHVTNPRVAFYEQNAIFLSRKYIGNIGLSLPINEWSNMILYGDYFQQGSYKQGQAGLLYRNDLWDEDEMHTISITGGIIARWNDALIPTIKLDYYKFGIGLSYDMNISKLRPASQFRGGLECSISYRSYLNINNSSLSKVRCIPAF